MSVRILETTPPLEVGSSVTPGPSHWKTGVPVTPLGRETVQVRVTESPAMIAGEGVREMVAGSVKEEMSVNHLVIVVQSITVVYL